MICSRHMDRMLMTGVAVVATACSGGQTDRVSQLEGELMDARVQIEVLTQERDEAIEAAQRSRRLAIAPAALPAVETVAGAEGGTSAVAELSPVIAISNANAGVTEANNQWWRYAYRAQLSNLTGQPQAYSGRVTFIDANGLTVDSNTIPAGVLNGVGAAPVDGFRLVRMPAATRVVGAEVVIQTAAGEVRATLGATGQVTMPVVAQATSPPAQQSRQRPAARATLRTYSVPRMHIVDSTATVSGTVYNTGDAPFDGTVTAVITVDGREVASERVAVKIAAGGSAPVSALLRGIPQVTQSASARFDW